MDYKQVTELMKWHAMHSDMNGAEARLIMFMASSANHKTSKIQASHNELADSVGLSKSSVTKSIKQLEEKKAINTDSPASGRMVATYRIRTADELNDYFITEQNNPEIDDWYVKHDKFSEIELKRAEIEEEKEKCEDCTEDKACEMHGYFIKRLESSLKWREYQLWLADNPKPPVKVKMINGKKI